MADQPPILEPHLKSFRNTIEAIRSHLEWLEQNGKLNYTELERKQIKAGTPENEIISADMLRLFKNGKIKSFAAERAEAFCRTEGLQIFIVHPDIP